MLLPTGAWLITPTDTHQNAVQGGGLAVVQQPTDPDEPVRPLGVPWSGEELAESDLTGKPQAGRSADFRTLLNPLLGEDANQGTTTLNWDGGPLKGEVIHPALLADLGLHHLDGCFSVDQVNPTELVPRLGLHIPEILSEQVN